MSRNAPHPTAAVEGYYSKFDLENGASLVLVICSVRQADQFKKPHMVSLTHYPARGMNIWQQQIWDRQIVMRRLGRGVEDFELKVPGIGAARYCEDGSTEYELDFNEFTFRAKTEGCIDWSGQRLEVGRETSPEGWLSYLPLPLHWHVSSLAAPCTYDFQVHSPSIPRTLASSGSAIVHQEKNWGNSFPKNHIWIQARDNDRFLCLAGGSTLGVQAYLVGYRSGDRNWDFRPPFAMQVLGYSPFLSTTIDWGTRSVELDICTWNRRLRIKARTEPDTFFTLGGPFPEGHREDAMAQSFRTEVDVTVYERSWVFGPWEERKKELFERASLEFGGEHFGGLKKNR